MTKIETVQILERMVYPEPWEDYDLSDKAKEALQMAIDALERPREIFTCEGCKYNHYWRYQNICGKCMRSMCDNYEAEGEG